MTRILLVDDRPAGQDAIRSLLAHVPGLLVVGQDSHGQALLGQLPATPADVVLLAVAASAPDTLAALQRLRTEFAEMRILVLLTSADERLVSQFFAAGAHGCVLASTLGEELVVAIRAVAAGRQFLCSDLGLLLLHKMQAKAVSVSTTEAPIQTPLTRRETEILRLLADGLTTSEMAEKLFTSKRTVETHRQNMLEKTQTKNTAALIRLAMTQGLLD